MIPRYDDDEESGRTGGSQSGGLEFHDFLSSGVSKLPPEQEKQKLAEHKEKNSSLIEKQKKLRDDRKDSKAGRTAIAGNSYGNAQAAKSSYKQHPIIGHAAEFDGVDPQMNLDPNKNEAETNSEKKEELTYQYQARYELQNQDKFTPPKLTPGG